MIRPAIALLAAVGLTLTALPASAQNASQISQVRRGSSCPGCNLFQGDFSGLERTGLNLSGARIRQADISLSVMNRTNFSRSDLRDVEAYGAVLSSSNFTGADLTNASFVGTYLEGATFTGAKLHGTNLSGAEMSRARGLTQSQLNQACGDQNTVLPSGLRIPAC